MSEKTMTQPLRDALERLEQLREPETEWLAKSLSGSISNLGYPVGCGIAPDPDALSRAANVLFDRFVQVHTALISAPAPSGEAVPARELQPYQPAERNTLGAYLNRFGARQYTNGEIEFGSAMALDAMIQTIINDCQIAKDVQRATRPPAAERLHTLDEWHEDIGPVLWWVLPIDEPPYCGEPLDDDWPGYHTHWTYITTPSQAAIDAARQGEGK